MKSPIVKRSVMLAKHKTSVSLEDAFWDALKEIAKLQGKTTQTLVAEIDRDRDTPNLSSGCRQFILEFYRDRARQLQH